MEEVESTDTPFEPVSTKNETFGAETPVTGKSQMQAAWSADSGDDEAGAQVAAMPEGQPSATSMDWTLRSGTSVNAPQSRHHPTGQIHHHPCGVCSV